MPVRPTPRRLLGATLGLALACGGSLLATSQPARAATACETLDAPVYSALHKTTKNSLLTPWAGEERGSVDYGFDPQGEMALGAVRDADGLVRVHRMYRKTQFRTVAESQVADLVAQGWKDQGVSFRAAPAGAGCGIGVHSVAREGVVREVLDTQLAAVAADGWSDRGELYRLAADPALPQDAPASPGAEPLPPASEVTDADADGRFSLAVIPDTQNETTSNGGLKRMEARNQWILANRDARDVRVALQVGDIVNWDTPSHDQYVRAEQGMKLLEDAGLPWVGTIGNHDAQATSVGGSARPGVDTRTALRDTSTYNRYFDASSFVLRRGTETPGVQDNSFHSFEAGGARFLVVVLELWPREDKLAWAEKVVASHPDHNVILLTHNYLGWGGSVAGDNGGYGNLPVTAVHDRIVARHPNVKLVLGGHVGLGETLVEDVNGHRVVAMTNNYDNNADALLRMIEVDVDAGTLTHTYSSTNSSRVVTGPTTVTGIEWIR